MSEKVIAQDFRKTKEIKLPASGITVVCYSSLLVSDLASIKPDETSLDSNLQVVIRVIQSWNFYASEKDEKPLEINLENFKKLPAPDFQFLVDELKVFSTEQKKS